MRKYHEHQVLPHSDQSHGSIRFESCMKACTAQGNAEIAPVIAPVLGQGREATLTLSLLHGVELPAHLGSPPETLRVYTRSDKQPIFYIFPRHVRCSGDDTYAILTRIYRSCSQHTHMYLQLDCVHNQIVSTTSNPPTRALYMYHPMHLQLRCAYACMHTVQAS